MKLLYVIGVRLLLFTTLILAFWAVLFYQSIMQEISDEVDETLEDYAESIIIRESRGKELPNVSYGLNNQFFIRKVTQEYAESHPKALFEDRDVFIKEINEYTPARVYTYIYKGSDGSWNEIEVSTPHVDKNELRDEIFSWLMFLLTAILLVIVVVNVWAVQNSMRPLQNLLKWLDAYRLGNNNQPLDNPTNISEFIKLNETAAQSMARNEKLYEQQKQFIGNAAHELQTPIAVCLNRLEMMLDDDTLSERQIEEIGKTLQTLGNLSRLNRSLLLLSKIENGQFNDNKRIDLSAQLTSLFADYEEIYSHRQISVEIQVKAPFIVKMDESLSTVLLSNLIKNAYIHNYDGGKISINMSHNELRISNTGSCTPLDEKKVFNRFYNSGKKTSTGLGLSITKAICTQYNLQIKYRFDDGRHHFIVKSR